ncbi:MAG: hypothetical protein K2X32_06800, partial [Phycisphaerales bacterium]|nr:hypothetical protein [Phycisphaerales bacterium]
MKTSLRSATFVRTSALAIAMLIAAAGAPAHLNAQSPAPTPAPAPAPTPAPAPAPAPYVPPPAATITSADADVKAIAEMLVGTFESKPVGDLPALAYRAAVVNVAGLDNAVYFEVGRTDAPWSSFRSGLFHVY